MYIKRHLQAALVKAEKMFGAILVTGSRQVGKTTLLRNAKPDLPYVTLDDPIMLSSAVSEPGTFFRATPPPLLVDEIQYAPQLFPHIKMSIDTEGRKGQFFLSGSQQYVMMKNVSESLAGRIGILNLYGLSLREIQGIDFNLPFHPDPDYLEARRASVAPLDYKTVWERIHQGAMPAMSAGEDMDWNLFYAAYVRTYLERDVRDLAQVGDEIKFLQFMTAAAALTGQLLNVASLARDAGVSQPTAERWLAILRASNLVYLLQPYHNNVIKRAVKTPKLYFLDTGLAAYLTRWNTPEVLQNGAMAGAFFETFVVAEILKSYANAGILDPALYFYRDKEQNEIDLLLYRDQTLFPIEIKKYADPKVDDVKAFAILDKLPGVKRGPGGLVCLYDTFLPLNGEDVIVPLAYI
ncbi:MAG: ATP-binding protein [Planctomycetota bacterium]|jgi:predicted AAA+ superfamily ATPase|nr:ATP-binding protein [Planctomycetota bacterium]